MHPTKTAQSPAQHSPAMKKQRGAVTPINSKLAQDALEAIDRRRNELARLQMSFEQRPKFSVDAESAPTVPHQQSSMDNLRKSDSLPASAPKASSTSKLSSPVSYSNRLAKANATVGSQPPPPPPPPAISRNVARRLDDFDPQQPATRIAPADRSASAPPARPPPPPPPGVARPSNIPRAPSSGNATSSALPTTSRPLSAESVGGAFRHYVGRPQPVTPTGNVTAIPASPRAQPPLKEAAKLQPKDEPPKNEFPKLQPKADPPKKEAPKLQPENISCQGGIPDATRAPHMPPLQQPGFGTVQSPRVSATAAAIDEPPKFPVFQSNSVAAYEKPKNKATSFAPSPLKNEPSTPTTPPHLKDEEPDFALRGQQPTKAFAGATPFMKQQNTAITPFAYDGVVSKAGESVLFANSGGAPPEVGTPRSSARRDMIRGIRDAIDSPMNKELAPSTQQLQHPEYKLQESAELRMQKELVQAQKEKATALRQLAQVEQEMEKLKQEAEKNAQAAARNQTVAFLSPLAPSSLPLSPTPFAPIQHSPHLGRRVQTPHPKRRPASEDQGMGGEDEREDSLLPFFREAVGLVPFEYESDGASFLVRRPYGVESFSDLWFENGLVGSKVYANQATVAKKETVEVVVLIGADASKLVLFGQDKVRHGNRDGSWHEFEDTREQEPLGNVTYIDSEANEQVYALEVFYQGAVSVRDLYCSSVLSTAKGLQKKKREEPPVQAAPKVLKQPPPMMMQQPQPVVVAKKPPMADASVDTEDLPQPAVPKQQSQEQPNQAPPASPKPTSVPAPQNDDNVMGVFMGMVISLLWTLFVQLPWRILSTVFTLVVSVAMVAMVWMYLANDRLGGPTPVASLFNPPGIL